MNKKRNYVQFKSNPEFFEKEKNGLKPNTLRKIVEMDERFHSMRKGCKNIDIINAHTGESFEREITDYSEYEGYAIISWKDLS